MRDKTHENFQSRINNPESIKCVFIAAEWCRMLGYQEVVVQPMSVAPTRSVSHLYTDQGDIHMLDANGRPCSVETKHKAKTSFSLERAYPFPDIWLDSPERFNQKMRSARPPVAYINFCRDHSHAAIFPTYNYQKLITTTASDPERGYETLRVAALKKDLEIFQVPPAAIERGYRFYEESLL